MKGDGNAHTLKSELKAIQETKDKGPEGTLERIPVAKNNHGMGIAISFHVFLMIPYLLTIFALISVSRKASVPAGLLKPYRREEKGG